MGETNARDLVSRFFLSDKLFDAFTLGEFRKFFPEKYRYAGALLPPLSTCTRE